MNDAPVWKMCLENFNSQISDILAKALDEIWLKMKLLSTIPLLFLTFVIESAYGRNQAQRQRLPVPAGYFEGSWKPQTGGMRPAGSVGRQDWRPQTGGMRPAGSFEGSWKPQTGGMRPAGSVGR